MSEGSGAFLLALALVFVPVCLVLGAQMWRARREP